MSQVYTWPPISATAPVGGATSANQVLEIAQLTAINSNTTGASTAAKQDTGNASLASIDSKLTNPLPVSAASLPLPSGAATEATLSSLNGKITAVNTGAVVVSSSALPTGAATEATLSSLNGKVTAVNTGAVVVSSSALPTGAATESTLSSLNAKVTAVNTGAVVVSSSALPSGAATEATIAARLSGSFVPHAYDEVVITYVGASTDIDTIVYKLASSTVKTLTMSYDGSDRLSGVVAS